MTLGNKTKMAWELKARGEDLCNERARDTTSSRTCRKRTEYSLEKHLLLTGTLKLKISLRNHFPRPLSCRS